MRQHCSALARATEKVVQHDDGNVPDGKRREAKQADEEKLKRE